LVEALSAWEGPIYPGDEWRGSAKQLDARQPAGLARQPTCTSEVRVALALERAVARLDGFGNRIG